MSEPLVEGEGRTRSAERKRLGNTTGRQDWSTWPAYDAAVVGFENYWYPTVWSRDVGDKPVPIKILGESIMLVRDHGRVYALHNRCPHRGVPLSYGSKELAGTISCRYHGWSFDLASGEMCAALTDGPESRINGRVEVRTFPVEERLGIVWVYVGSEDAPVPPVSRDIPPELLAADLALGGKIVGGRSGNWRLAAENGFDEGHAKYLHQGSLFMTFRTFPAWTETHIEDQGQGWITRVQDAVHWEYVDKTRGTWKVDRWWRRRVGTRPGNDPGRPDPTIDRLELKGRTCIRMPGQLRVAFSHWVHYEFYVPEDANHHRYVQFAVHFGRGRRAVGWLAQYLFFLRPVFHGQFTGQDSWMVHVMDAPPEKLYRPDVSITAWRKMVQSTDATPHRIEL